MPGGYWIWAYNLLSNSPKRSLRFLRGYEGTENMFYFLNVEQPRIDPKEKQECLELGSERQTRGLFELK